ncbi:EXS family-domain-containing protein [Umbelopsis sp. PMI_123]|nr:EXS family-domain-containing protein [Umbelopsis sp. PMI_123]
MVYVMYIDFTEMFAPTIPSEICPLIFFIITIVILFCPFNILYLSARRWLGIALGRIFLSYCFRVEFRDFFIADELNSLSYSFWTLSYFFCAYGWHWTNLDQHCPITKMWFTPVIAALPPWWRLLQCIRRYKDSRETVHLINAGKYVTSIWATSLTGVRRIHNYPAMQAAWIVACIINSTYTSAWDLKMDWGLLQRHSRNFLLRNDLVFYHWTYYVAMPVNVILRFSWIVNTVGLPVGGEVLGFISGGLEACRRLQWNFFRLENEHLNNCGQFRAIKEIPLPFSVMEETQSRRGSEIRLPTDDTERYPEQEMTNVTRRNTLKKLASRPSSTQGTFYGRRDFESKRDDDTDEKRKSSDGVFNRITNLVVHSPDSDSEEDDDDDEEVSHSDT